MAGAELLRLQQIEVDRLFNIYNHRIDLNLDERVTFLHGPNGVGKTVILRMINGLLRKRLGIFRTIPFAQFRLGFQDGSTLTLSNVSGEEGETGNFVLSLITGGVKHSESIVLTESRAESIAARISYLKLSEVLPDTWVDARDGETLTASEVVSRYGESPPPAMEYEDSKLPWFTEFLMNANTYLIEAQRLVRVKQESRPAFVHFSRSYQPATISTVIERSHDFRERLSATMADYGRQSQTLDQSFPQRLISATKRLTVSDLQMRMSNLDKKTAEFKSIGILDETPTHPFPVASLDNIDSTQARVMTLYVHDTEQKLQALQDLATRTLLLLENVNQKYRYKRIRLDRAAGFVAENDDGEIVPLDSLSSGEQHELVLHYDLLFQVPTNTIVLIDEPELSLHVAWQKRFLPDLLDIIRLSDFDALVATHSPYIIGDRVELMTALGDGK